MYIRDQKSKIKWLVDGGAILSILPPLPAQRKNGPNGTKLSAANGTSIPCFGTTRHSVTLGSKIYPFNFIIADVKQTIIGADFLAHFNLAPNHRNGCLIDLQNFETRGYFKTIKADFAPDSEKTRVNFISHKEDPFFNSSTNIPISQLPRFGSKTQNTASGITFRLNVPQSKIEPENSLRTNWPSLKPKSKNFAN